ncbi:MAG: 3' terminal RNA ribose 2'-O-methyltransferase Hen1 [Actinomycetota bacterium]|nr:3' terminal RNA ribose 2'-O-methyltransferase Hen1 [Actinomycetota bacterium]
MLLTLTTTHEPATDLGYLLHKNPASTHERELPFGRAHVVYPEASAARCTAALMVEVDPVGLVRRSGRDVPATAAHHVNDRPYAASSLLSVAIAKVFNTALGGRSKDRPELAETGLPLRAQLPVVPVRGGPDIVRRLFEPLGYTVTATPLGLDPTIPAWGDSRYVELTLETTCRLRDLLEHLYVLLPVLDDDKHYWVGDSEVDKLLRRGGDWLAAHPERDLITRRYLRHDRRLADDAIDRLLDGAGTDREPAVLDDPAAGAAAPISLGGQRLDAVVALVQRTGARRVADLGCGEGRLVGRLLRDTDVDHVLGVDVSVRALQRAARHLHLDTMAPRQLERVELVQASLTYRDDRLAGHDLAALVEVIEHLDPARLDALERTVFGHARPATVVVTTPNVEYNARFVGLAAGEPRHRDHRFEWTRAELAEWANGVAGRNGYDVELGGIGDPDPELGAPTQMAVFRR